MTGPPPSRKSRRNSRHLQGIGSPLQAARRFEIPRTLALETVEVLERAGVHGHEAFVLWGGVTDGATVQFKSLLIPEQQGHQTPDGLLVTVDGDALFEVNRHLFARNEILAAQVHSHPTDAYHSDTDDCHALVTLTGALSVVVPYFGASGLDTTGWAWYRLTGQATFEPLDRDDEVLLIEEPGCG